MEIRVTLLYAIIGEAPSEAAMDNALAQLLLVASDAGPVLTLTPDALEVTLAFDAPDAPAAVSLASAAVGAVLGGGVIGVRAESVA